MDATYEYIYNDDGYLVTVVKKLNDLKEEKEEEEQK